MQNGQINNRNLKSVWIRFKTGRPKNIEKMQSDKTTSVSMPIYNRELKKVRRKNMEV